MTGTCEVTCCPQTKITPGLRAGLFWEGKSLVSLPQKNEGTKCPSNASF